MRIVYPLLWSRPDRKACRQQTMGTVAALARRGHEIVLLIPRAEGDPALSPAELRAYFHVEGDFSLVQRSSRWAGDALVRSLMWLNQAFHDPEVGKAQILYSRIPAMLGMGRRPPVPYALDHYRPWPDVMPVIRPVVRRTARQRKFLGMVVHSAYAAQAYERAGIMAEKLLVAHNGADPYERPAPQKQAARSALGLPAGRAIAAYAGRVNRQKGLDQFLALADLRPDVLFLLIGSEGDGAIEREARARPNVMVVPWQDPLSLRAWLAAADLLLVPASRAPLEHFRNCVLPLKLFSYLAAARPILAPATPDMVELLRDGDNALLVPADNPIAAAAALDRILNEPNLADRLGQNARAVARELTWDRRAEKIDVFLEERLQSQ